MAQSEFHARTENPYRLYLTISILFCEKTDNLNCVICNPLTVRTSRGHWDNLILQVVGNR